jgi:hypothetical protein
MRRSLLRLFIVPAVLAAWFGCKDKPADHGHGPGDKTASNISLSIEEGKKYPAGSDRSFKFSFSKKPAMGMTVVKIELFDQSGKPAADLLIKGDSGMPSMKGSHDTGDVDFKLNKQGIYLLPVNVVMPGKWEVKLKFMKDKNLIHQGRIEFDV